MANKGQRKHVPQRTCVICRQKTDKRQLTRVVSTVDEGVIVDVTGKRNGRGAYICSRSTCWEKAVNSVVLNQALRTEVSKAEKEALAQYRATIAPQTNES